MATLEIIEIVVTTIWNPRPKVSSIFQLERKHRLRVSSI